MAEPTRADKIDVSLESLQWCHEMTGILKDRIYLIRTLLEEAKKHPRRFVPLRRAEETLDDLLSSTRTLDKSVRECRWTVRDVCLEAANE